MPMNDVLNSDIFSLTSLTQAINKLPYKPGRIGQMGLFGERGITTTTVVIEEREGVLALIPTGKRGGPAQLAQAAKRKARSLVVPHLALEDTILAESIQNVRAFGTENQLESVAQVVNDRLEAMRQSHEVTLEYHRIGAIQGQILDADGTTVIYNLFSEFGVSETTVDFVLGTATTDIRGKCLQVKRAVEDALGATVYDHIHAFCGKNWFEKFVSHTLVRDAYSRYLDGEMLRNDPRAGFRFAGITFEEYRGSVSGVSFINDDEARFFPVGVPGLFMTYFAPADFMETANTIGLPIYAKQERMEFDRGIKLHTQSNPLSICHRPAVLVKGTTSN